MKKSNGHELKIEHGLPIPPTTAKKGYVDVIRKMQVGDSVVIPGPASTAYNAVRYCGGNKTTFTGRAVEGGTRIWRIA